MTEMSTPVPAPGPSQEIKSEIEGILAALDLSNGLADERHERILKTRKEAHAIGAHTDSILTRIDEKLARLQS